MSAQYKVVEDSSSGFKYLYPKLDAKSIDDFYKTKYYEMIKVGDGKPDHLARMLSSNLKESSSEELWLKKTLYADVIHHIKKYSTGKKILEIGCGTGNLLCELESNDFDVCGIDPSSYAIEVARARGCKNVHAKSLKEFYDTNVDKFDVVILINILEHVPDPYEIMSTARGMLNDNGIVIIIVPNDFTKLQALAKRRLKLAKEWWVAIPDHINYFNFSSLNKFMSNVGFKNCYWRSDFPMELFLLAGLDYTNDKSIGAKCHNGRVKMEMLLPNAFRRFLYSMCAKFGIGRTCYYVGRVIL